MISYIYLLFSICLLFFTIFYPEREKSPEYLFKHHSIDFIGENIRQTNGVVHVTGKDITHVFSLHDREMNPLVTFRFNGSLTESDSVSFAISGSVDVISINNMTSLINDRSTLAYLLLKQSPMSASINILSINNDYVIFEDLINSRSYLLVRQ